MRNYLHSISNNKDAILSDYSLSYFLLLVSTIYDVAYYSRYANHWNKHTPNHRMLLSIFLNSKMHIPGQVVFLAAFLQAASQKPRLLPSCGFKVPLNQSADKGKEKGLHIDFVASTEITCVTSTMYY